MSLVAGTVPRTAVELDEVLGAMRSFRRTLDLDRPVPREVLEQCLSVARHAPSGANRQGWHFLLIDDPTTKAAIARHYRRAFAGYLTLRPPPPERRRDVLSARFLADNLHRVPVLVLACLRGRPPADAARLSSYYGSIYPAVWSFMVAARARGLGTSLTTVHLAYEREVAALVGIPFDEVAQIALVPVGYLRAVPRRAAERRPLAQVTSWNRWEGDL